MNYLTIIRHLDLQYLYDYKPETYTYYTLKLKERLSQGMPVEIILDDATSFLPANADRFEKFLKDEVEGRFVRVVRC